MSMIELNDVSLTFNLRSSRKVSLKEYILKGLFLPTTNPSVAIHALSHVNLTADEGDRIGIIGHNGAGKSTLLKLLAGIYPATSGRCIVRGKIGSLFDINVGFEAEASGWDNIYYRGYLQGETPHTLKKKIQGIADFTELGDFLNLPVRYYSAGMMVRFAFAIATAVEPEVLLIDEMLSAGDLAFQKKAVVRMREMISSSRTVVLVSHDLASVATLCTKVYWFQHGQVLMSGTPDEVISAYMESVGPSAEVKPAENLPTEVPAPAAVEGTCPTCGAVRNTGNLVSA